MGTVYLADDPLIGRTVAIKEIRVDQIKDVSERTELEARFKLEFRSAGTLSHPNIVTIYDVGEEGGSYFIAMEYVAGMSLAERLKKEPSPRFEELCDLAIQIASGLDYAHERGIVHRDIKPANVLLTHDGRPKITDFGLARWRTSELTMTGTVLGTPAFMSPEQVMGKPVDGKSDQFSFAIIAYLMLTGDQPFHAEHPSAILYKIVHEEPPLPGEVNRVLPAAVDRTMLRALAKKPEDRYSSCSELAAELRGVLLEEQQTTLLPRPAVSSQTPDTSSSGEGGSTENHREEPDAPDAGSSPSTPDDVTLAATPAPRRPPRHSRSIFRWFAGALFIAAIGALAFWASDRRRAGPEPAAASKTALPPTALDEPPTAGAVDGEAIASREVELDPASPEAVPEVAASPTSLRITSVPEGAAIRFGDHDTGLITPADIELDAEGPQTGQRHALELTLAGYDPASWSFTLDELSDDQRACACLHFPLVSSAPPGMLTVNAPYPVSIEVNGRRHGPFKRGEVPVVPGSHKVVILAADVFLRQTSDVEIGSGERRSLRVPKAVAVRITANPANCEVSVDGAYLDVTPINRRRIAVGPHDFSFYWPALDVRKSVRKKVTREGQRISATPN